MQKLILYLIATLVLFTPIASRVESQSVLSNNFSARREKIVEQLEQMRNKGAGTKMYENILSTIDYDIAISAPKEQINDRLTSLERSIKNQLDQIEFYKSGALNLTVSSSELKQWGQYSPYLLAVQSKIRANWHPPEYSHSQLIKVAFQISRDGRSNNLKIIRSAGTLEIDKSILKAVESACPFAPLPSFCKDKAIDIELSFNYSNQAKPLTKPASSDNARKPELKNNNNSNDNSFDINTFVYTAKGGISVGNVSPDFLKEVKGYVAAMPKKLLAELQSRGARVCVTPRMADKLLGFSYEQPRGWEDGAAGRNVDGVFDGTDAIICEYTAAPGDELSLVKNNRVAHVVYHELGHACDRYWHEISTSSEFKDMYMHELANMDSDEREGKLAYFAQKTYAGPVECFAELFAIIVGGGKSKVDTSLSQYFPKCSQIIRQKLEI
jgi:TonB family protein